MSDYNPKKALVSKMAGTTGPTPRPGSAPMVRNKYGDVLTPTRSTNNQPSRISFGSRFGKQYQSGTTKSGNVVHFYSDGTRVVLNKKANPTFKRNI
jgi:hypothetical protein